MTGIFDKERWDVQGGDLVTRGSRAIKEITIKKLTGNLDANSNEITNAAKVSTDDLDIGGSDLVATGDFFPIFSFNNNNKYSLSTTSTTYVDHAGVSAGRVIWDEIRPANAQLAVISYIGVAPGTSESVDLRLRNMVDGETVHEVTGVTSTGTQALGPTNYTPSTTSNVIELQHQIRTDPGDNSSTFNINNFTIGVQL